MISLHEKVIYDCIKGRRSVRVYKKCKINESTLLKLIEAACYAPAGGNQATWEVIVIFDDSLKDKITKISLNQEFIKEASVVLVFIGGRVVEVAMAIQNLLLMAHALGLEGCCIGAFDRSALAEILNIPKNIPIHYIVTIGKPDEPLTDPAKKFPEEVIHYEIYGNLKVDRGLLIKVLTQAKEKLKEFREIRDRMIKEYGPNSYQILRLEEKYAAFVFRPLLKRIIRLLKLLRLDEPLCRRIEDVVNEYERSRSYLLAKTKNINSKEVIALERKYSTIIFPQVISEIIHKFQLDGQ